MDVCLQCRYMSHSRFETIRHLVKYSKADVDAAVHDPWAMFRLMVQDFNANRQRVVGLGLMQVLDESMSNWQPRKDKLGGLPNISFIKRKPKPLGTEFKCITDAASGIMVHMEIQEGRDPMRMKQYARELGVTTACTVRMAEAVGNDAPLTYIADSWFGSVKVRCCPVLFYAVLCCAAVSCFAVHVVHAVHAVLCMLCYDVHATAALC